MKVIDFVNEFVEAKSDTVKVGIVQKQIKNVKIGYGSKAYLAREIATNSCTKNGRLHIDSLKRYFDTTLMLLSLYTEIEVDPKDATNEYNMLNDCDALKIILEQIDEKEKSEFMTMVQMACDDCIANNSSFQNWVENIIGTIAPTLEVLRDTVGNMDQEQMGKILEFAQNKGN